MTEDRGSLPPQNDNHECDLDLGPFIEKIRCIISCGLVGEIISTTIEHIRLTRKVENAMMNRQSLLLHLGGWHKVGYHNQILAH